MIEERDTQAAEIGGGRLLTTLERLLAVDATDLHAALDQACLLVAEALGADKVDAAFHDPASDSLVAIGTSSTPMGRAQHALGMNRLPVANGGREIEVFQSGESYATGRADQDPGQLRGMTEGLGIRSSMVAPLDVAGERRGVFMVASAKPNFFTAEDRAFLLAVSHWVGMVAHRVELVEQLAAEAKEQGRRIAADELITTLAHDLSNHLTPFRARLDLLRGRARREERARDLHDLEEAARALGRIRRLITDLLDAGRLEQGIFTLNRQPVDLVRLVREVADAFATEAVPIQVEMPEELLVPADSDRIRQAVENLLSNAIKHSPAGASVGVEIVLDPRDAGHWVTVTVADEGPGISAELLPRLFDRFARGPDSTGLGLGLYLASRIAAAHGGTLTVDSMPGSGARLRLRLPTGGVPSDDGSNAGPRYAAGG